MSWGDKDQDVIVPHELSAEDVAKIKAGTHIVCDGCGDLIARRGGGVTARQICGKPDCKRIHHRHYISEKNRKARMREKRYEPRILGYRESDIDAMIGRELDE